MISLEKHIKLLLEMLSIPALSRQEGLRADKLEKWLKNEGLHVDRIHNNLMVTSDGNLENKRILLNSHIDTVPASEDWNSDPFKPVLENGKITALGSNDAGASVVSMIAAFQALSDRGLSSEVILLISAEEEVSGKKGVEAVLSNLKSVKFAIVGEPTRMQPAVAERGLMVIDGIARGRSGHAARDEGINAIYIALEDIRKIREISFNNRSEWLPDPLVSVTMIDAGTGHNVVPGECKFVIDARSNDQYSNKQILEILEQTCISELTPRSLRLKSSSLSAEHPVFAVIEKIGLSPFGSSTMSDMALLPFPSIKMGPGDSARSHTANEYIMETEIKDAISIYVLLTEELLNIDL